MEKYLDATREQFMAFMALPIDKPLKMLNLLKFKDKVEGSDISGEEQYNIYMKAAIPFIKETEAEVIFYGSARFTLIGPEAAEWDKVILVSYPSRAHFVKMVTNENYPAALRIAALEDSRLIFCEEIG
jgi:uncharacterized protein (DUF1330 family)